MWLEAWWAQTYSHKFKHLATKCAGGKGGPKLNQTWFQKCAKSGVLKMRQRSGVPQQTAQNDQTQPKMNQTGTKMRYIG